MNNNRLYELAKEHEKRAQREAQRHQIADILRKQTAPKTQK